MWKKAKDLAWQFICIFVVVMIVSRTIDYLVDKGWWFHGPKPVDARKIPDVVIEREMFRRVGNLSADTCTFCKEHWRVCECEMGKHPLMFQNREQQTPETIRAELLKYNVKLDK